MIDKLLFEHVGQPHVLDLAVHPVIFFGWMSQVGHFEPLLLLSLFYQSTPSCFKVVGGVVGWVVAHVIIVSAQSKNWDFGFFRLGLTLGSDFGPVGTGDWGLGLGLDNKLVHLLLILPSQKFSRSHLNKDYLLQIYIPPTWLFD